MPYTILVVEDTIGMLENIQFLLETDNYNVLTAKDGIEALSVLENEIPDLIISDIMMPNLDGYGLYEHIKNNPKLKIIPFIFLTAKETKEDIRLGKELGVDDYLIKPFEIEDLLAVVRGKLRRSEQIKSVSKAKMEKIKKKIMKIINHEFRTPLTTINGYIDLLLDNYYDSEEELHLFLQILKDSEVRLNDLIIDFLQLAKIESGQMLEEYSNNKIRIELKLILLIVIANLENQLKEKQINVELEIEESLPEIIGTEEILTGIFTKLLGNAIKFSPAKASPIKIHLYSKNMQVYCEIIDKGQGIPTSEILKIFDIFYQIDRNLYEQQGAGLGLSICQKLIELLNGKIEVESELGKGSTFRIILPICN